MTKTDRASFYVPLLNPIVKGLLRMGVSFLPVGMTLLTTRGRKSGQARTTPVGLFVVDGSRYLFSTFGEVNWVRNIRSESQATITYDGTTEEVVAIEVPPVEAAAVLRAAFTPLLRSRLTRRMLRSQYEVTPESSLSDYESIALQHPVFELHSNVAVKKNEPGAEAAHCMVR